MSKNSNARSTTWSAATETGGKSYNLGTYRTEEEAALARNYGDELLRHPKPVRNIIPPDLMPDEIVQAKLARAVVLLLRGKVVVLSSPSNNEYQGSELDGTEADTPSASSAQKNPEVEITDEPEAGPEASALSEHEQQVQRLLADS